MSRVRIYVYESGPLWIAELPGEFRREYTDQRIAVLASLSWAESKQQRALVVEGRPKTPALPSPNGDQR